MGDSESARVGLSVVEQGRSSAVAGSLLQRVA